MNIGDKFQHKRFGECQIDKIENNGDYTTVWFISANVYGTNKGPNNYWKRILCNTCGRFASDL